MERHTCWAKLCARTGGGGQVGVPEGLERTREHIPEGNK